ncbi:MAG: IPT/TIG domain-containing protein, partial [candidate division KSB1 bacterium]|nr:IPT/TIG domain-containing protein [candidate division KSB1 bacterium]
MRSGIFILIGGLLTAAVGVLQAVSLPLSEEQLITESRQIVFGEVVATNSYWNAERTNIFTEAEIRVEKWLKGNGGSASLRIKYPGGRVGDIVEEHSETPMLVVGERAVFFLNSSALPFVGGRQGKIDVIENKVYQNGKAVPVDEYFAKITSKILQLEPQNRLNSLESPVIEWAEIKAPVDFKDKVKNAKTDFILSAQPNNEIQGITTLLSDGFEGDFPGTIWTLYYNGNSNQDGFGYTWGKTTAQKHSGFNSVWCARGAYENQRALDPSKRTTNYPNDLRAWMVYGPFNLSDAAYAQMTFYYRLDSQVNVDFLYWMSSTDGINFSGFGASGSTNGQWVSQTLDLSSRCGQSQVWVAFYFYSDASVVNKGAFVDDVVITKQTLDPNSPQITSITPNKASAGTNTQVTITGTNFGNSQGTGKVEFFYRAGLPKISATILSWSNNTIVCTVPVGTINGYEASASSGLVTVTNSSGLISLGYPFTVTFGYMQRKWDVKEVFYYINENNPFIDGEGTAIKAAADTWTKDGDADFIFTYFGPTTATSRTYNGKNEIFWGALGSGSVIGEATTWYNPSTNTILECDITFNYDLNWGYGIGNFFDVQTITLHELGHWLSLRDLYGDLGDGVNDISKAMYGYGSTYNAKQKLHEDDRSGIIWIYGPEPEIDDNWSTKELADANAQLRAHNGRTKGKARVYNELCPLLKGQKAPSRWWSINAADPAYVRLYYTDELLQNAGITGRPVIAHFNGTEWEEIATSTPQWDADGKFIESVQPLTSFSPFTMFEGGPIAVRMTSLSAERESDAVCIRWTSANEINVAGYEVQRCLAPGRWEPVAGFADHPELCSRTDGDAAEYLFRDVHPHAAKASRQPDLPIEKITSDEYLRAVARE